VFEIERLVILLVFNGKIIEEVRDGLARIWELI
jgi:hypothetical protein